MTTDNTTETQTTNLSLSQAWKLWETAKRSVEEAQATEHEALRTVARAAGNKTFMYEGQLYQMRERKNAQGVYVPFLCALERSPKEWLADAREKRYAAAGAEQPSTPESEPEVPQEVTVEPDGDLVLE